MNGNILSIKEKQPVDVVLPDGVYLGVWGGHAIELGYKGKTYELETDIGIKGIGYKVVVTVKDGKATYAQINN